MCGFCAAVSVFLVFQASLCSCIYEPLVNQGSGRGPGAEGVGTAAALCCFHICLLQLDLITESVKTEISARGKVPWQSSWM